MGTHFVPVHTCDSLCLHLDRCSAYCLHGKKDSIVRFLVICRLCNLETGTGQTLLKQRWHTRTPRKRYILLTPVKFSVCSAVIAIAE